MRILFIQPFLKGYTLCPGAGGKDKAAYEMAVAACGKENEVFILPLPWGDFGQQEKLLSPVSTFLGKSSNEVVVCPTGTTEGIFLRTLRLLSKRQLLKSPRRAWRNARLSAIFDLKECYLRTVANLEPDLIIVNQTGSPAPLWSVDLPNRPCLILVNHSPTYSPYLDLYDHIVWVSGWQQSQATERWPFTEKKSRLIRYFVDLPYFAEPVVSTENVIVFIGLLDNDRKGLDILISALALTNSKSLLKVIGTGSEMGHFQSLASRAEVRVEFLGRVSDEENVRLLDESSLFVMPSRGESFGIVYVEAMARGVPAIGYSETIQELQQLVHPECGDPFDANKESPGHLAQLIDSRMRWSRSNSATRHLIAKKTKSEFAPEKFRRRYLKLITQLNS
ncbi:glycosyltransferase family 4 protein [bacterium]|nr:glycosyltransferase family 4 protein [bacterium]